MTGESPAGRTLAMPVEAAHALMFARAVAPEGRVDPCLPETGDPVPPTFGMALAVFDPAYPNRPRAGTEWIGSGGPSRVSPPAKAHPRMHAEQRFDFHRPLRVGDRLVATERPGRSWERVSRRAGTLRFDETMVRLTDSDGRPVADMTRVVLTPERVIEAAGPAPAAAGRPEGDMICSGVTRSRIVQYAGASGDFTPLHTDEIYARDSAGYPGVFAHGMLAMGMVGAELAARHGPHRIRSFGARFTAQVWPGDALYATFSTMAGGDGLAVIEITLRNGGGTVVLTADATLTAGT